MPNHVKNKIYFECDEKKLDEILTAIQYDPIPDEDPEYYGKGTIDFNKIIPMPESLMIESGSETNRGISLFLTAINPYTRNIGFEKMLPNLFESLVKGIKKQSMGCYIDTNMSDEEIAKATEYSSKEKLLKLGEAAVTNFMKYGFTSWYGWSIAHWGTKWNSYDPFKGLENGIEFSTAWSEPQPILEELSKRFPDVEITHQWANEDMGWGCGRREYLNGECVDEYIPMEDREALEYAIAVWDDDPADYFGEEDIIDNTKNITM